MPDESPITDLRHTESVIRAADSDAHAELRRLLAEVDTVQQTDIDSYAHKLVDRQGAPAARSSKVKARIADLELRTIPACDEALWLLAGKVVNVLDPTVDRSILTKNLRRWAKPKVVRDPSGVLASPTTHDPLDAHRPVDVVDWVLDRIDVVERGEADQRAKEDKANRAREAKRQCDAAQAAYDREQSIRLNDEEEAMAPSAVSARHFAQQSSGSPPWPPFDRHKFLRDNDLLEDYGYVQPGQAIQAKGGRERTIEQVPAEALQPVSTPA
jgi:hypothetical protein